MKILRRWFFSTAALCFIATSGLASADDIILRWDANIESDLQKYNIYYGTQSGSYSAQISVGKITEYTFQNLEPGNTYFFAISAVDNAGNESDYSSESSVVIPEYNDKQAPVANCTVSPLSGPSPLDVSFDGWASEDLDGGPIVLYEWDFDGDGTYDWSGPETTSGITTYTYNDIGAYNVVLRVTDDEGATGTDSVTVTVSEPVTYPSDLTLSVKTYKISGKKFADLTWSGANSTSVDVYRDGSLITDAAGTPNDGEYIHGPLNSGKPAKYQVCENGASICSNEVAVSW